MRHDAVFLAYDVRCGSADEAVKVEAMVRRLGGRDAILQHEVTGGGKSVEISHRVGDYFQEILVLPPNGEDHGALRVVFHRSPEAGRFWKDLMVRIVRAIEEAFPRATVTLVHKGDERLDWSRLGPVRSEPN
jgi:hypothetical protein